jgi:type VI secretion system protein ImpH
MAGPTRQSPDPVAVTMPLAADPTQFTLFGALRLIEQAYRDQPRLGEARKASDDPVRLAQPPIQHFAHSDVAGYSVDPDRSRPRLLEHSFGMFGPNGALPLHLTEYAQARQKHADDPTFSDFVNLFQHRLIALFYRAWANADPATNHDRPERDRFQGYIGALMGLAPESARRRDAANDLAKFARCGRYASHARSADDLRNILADYFELPITVRQFVGSWLDIPPDSWSRLGGIREYALLGSGATLGGSSWQCQHRFEVAIGPLSLAQFRDFLPGSRGLEELRALVKLFTNREWAFQVRLLLRDVEVPGMVLGSAGELGWTSWVGGRRVIADDVVLEGDIN